MLSRTQWNGAHACLELIGQVDLTIAELYNRAEPAFTKSLQGAPGAQEVQEQPELAAAPEQEAYGGAPPEPKEGE